MRIAIIGPGEMTIPPIGWGAVETIIYEYYTRLNKLGHEVLVVNTKSRVEIVKRVNDFNPDFVHCQYDELVDVLPMISCPLKAITSHFGYLDQVWSHEDYLFNIHKKIIALKNVFIFALSESIASRYIDDGVDSSRVYVLPNGVDFDNFERTQNPFFDAKSIYLAKVDYRKRQGLIQSYDCNIDFVGNLCKRTALKSGFNTASSSYIGEWSRQDVRRNLTNYPNLVLLSDGEAHPLVCMEALAAGCGLVLSEYATANLDLTKPYIDVIPESKIKNKEYVADIVLKNRIKSISYRQDIVEYAKSFDWSYIIEKYIALIQNIKVQDKCLDATKKTVAVVTIATGKYFDEFIPALKSSVDKFLKSTDIDVNFYCFTDADVENISGIKKIHLSYIGWPFDTLLRFSIFRKNISELVKNDYVLYVDADMEFVSQFDAALFSKNIIAVEHPGFLDKKLIVGTYEISNDELSYVPSSRRKKYFQGCFWGGERLHFKKLVMDLASRVDQDLSLGKIPVWHDESYLNWYLASFGANVLPPSYAYPEGARLPFIPKVIHKIKPHNSIRKIEDRTIISSDDLLGGISLEEKCELYRKLYLVAHEKNQRLEWRLQLTSLLWDLIDRYFINVVRNIFSFGFYKKIIKLLYFKYLK